MCLGGSRYSPPPPPEPAPPAPPAVLNTVSKQASPAPTSEASRSSQELATTIREKKKGRKSLVIPLVQSSGSGLQY